MNNQATWTCSYCGRVDNTGSTCPSCGANRPQTTTYAPEIMFPTQDNSTVPVSASRFVFSGIVNGCIFLFLIPFFCGGIFSGVVTASEWHDLQVLSQSGTTTQATVTSRDVSTGSKNSTSYSVDYEFTANGQTYDNSDTVDADVYDKLETGSKVTIRYAQTDPTISHIGDHDSSDLAIFLTIFTVCWNAGLVIFFVFWVRQLARRRQRFA